MLAGFARAALAETKATYWKMPERREIATISIMPLTAANVETSAGATPNNRAVMNRVDSNAAARPTITPVITTFIP